MINLKRPFLQTGPTLISFSGGRTSAYMLHEILRAHGGQLPPDAVVCFANTGREREETLRFVHECGVRWSVPIHWLEWRDGKPGFEQVGFNSAARNGEPFSALIAKKRYLPNAVTRFCTQELKIRPMRDFCRALGWSRWENVIGLRHDEGHRVMKALARNVEGNERFTVAMPLAKARVTKPDVLRFWLGDNPDPVDLRHPLPQGFDLGLRDYEGNCDLCFLKGRKVLQHIMFERPDLAEWWTAQERNVRSCKMSGARFVTEYPYASLIATARSQGDLFGSEDYDAECGLHCGVA